MGWKPPQPDLLLEGEEIDGARFDPRDLEYCDNLVQNLQACADAHDEATIQVLAAQRAVAEAQRELDRVKAPIVLGVLRDPLYKNKEVREEAADDAVRNDSVCTQRQAFLDMATQALAEAQRDATQHEWSRREYRHIMDLATAWLQYQALVPVDEAHT